jgi:hypothetical protein
MPALTVLAFAWAGSALAQKPPSAPQRVITEGELRGMVVRAFDADQDHRISLGEFANFQGESPSSPSISADFRQWDTNNSGYLEGAELVAYVNGMIRILGRQCDQNHDHLFSGEEADCISEYL